MSLLLWYSKFHDGLVKLKREEVPPRARTKLLWLKTRENVANTAGTVLTAKNA